MSWVSSGSRGCPGTAGAAHGICLSLLGLPLLPGAPQTCSVYLLCTEFRNSAPQGGPLLLLDARSRCLSPRGSRLTRCFSRLPADLESSEVSFATLSVGSLRDGVSVPWTGQVRLHKRPWHQLFPHPQTVPCALLRPVGCPFVQLRLNQPPDSPWGPLAMSTAAPFLS